MRESGSDLAFAQTESEGGRVLLPEQASFRRLTVNAIDGGRVQLGVSVPADTPILRLELCCPIGGTPRLHADRERLSRLARTPAPVAEVIPFTIESRKGMAHGKWSGVTVAIRSLKWSKQAPETSPARSRRIPDDPLHGARRRRVAG
jgi:hypothetical protein